MATITPLTESARRDVFQRVLTIIDRKFMGPPVDLPALKARHEQAVVGSEMPEAFEQALTNLLKDLGTSHTGCFHEGRPRVAGRVAIAATFAKVETADGMRWVFQDVHPAGVAARAGVRSGDVLLMIDGQDMRPPDAVPFSLGQTYAFTIRRADGATASATMAVPGSREKQRPIVVPDQVVTTSKPRDDVGVVRISMFPGVLGMDVARDISRATAELQCPKLVVDLRGNTGGGIGCLRVMSHLCPDRRGVGYSLGRAAAQKGLTKDRLPSFDRIPSSKWGVIPLAVKFATASRSVAVFTEALGPQAHHGHVAVLVNEHSASAAEMIAGFVSEYRLATLVGTKTAGRLVATSAFTVGHGYRIAIPVAAYYTWQGRNLEGVGVTPDIEEPFSAEAVWHGHDPQLDRALACLS
ncbi:MAG TPA: S41 family peptidase [Vicinamibacterales bacterium]|jgi:C-terminal processing protease CtpA/Prc|nr:S41 family peptidase [Vicinamibacterales bacterium]